MPPRYAYWTIIVDDQATAFRSGSQEELMPTFKRLQQKHASAKMMWWQNGKLWNSRLDAQEAMRMRGAMGRDADFRQTHALSERRPTGTGGRRESKGARSGRPSERPPGPRERREERDQSGKLDWKPKGEGASGSRPPAEDPRPKPEWKPKGSFTPERQKFAADSSGSRPALSEGRASASRVEGIPDPGSRREKPGWKPKSFGARPRSDWKPKGRSEGFRPAGTDRRPASRKLEWTPKGESTDRSRIPDPGSREKRKWIPKAEYKKSLGIEAKKDKNWRPGGEHKDPRQKYKDAKKAKWTKFKKNIRARSEGKPRKKTDE